MTDPVVMDKGRKSRRSVLAAVALATLLLGAAGCSSVPDAVNPVEWYRGTRDWITGDDTVKPAKQAEAKPVPGADKPFPNLNSVPDRPPEMTEAERRRMSNTLVADRNAAHYTDEQIRRQTEAVTASPSSAPAPQRPAATAKQASVASAGANASLAARPPAPAPMPTQAATRKPALPKEVRTAEPAAGQVAALPQSRPQAMPSAPPPPPDVSSIIESGQPIPVAPAPSQAAKSTPAAPPPALRPPPAAPRTAFVRPAGNAAPQRQGGVGPVQGPASPAALPPATAPAFGAADGEEFATGAPPVATIYFGSGSTKVGARGLRAIREAFRLYQSRGGHIRIVGHASSRTRNMDRVSHELANFRISDERARAVARELVRMGVDPNAIIVEAVSDHQPAYIEVMPAGEAGNRRAEILLEP